MEIAHMRGLHAQRVDAEAEPAPPEGEAAPPEPAAEAPEASQHMDEDADVEHHDEAEAAPASPGTRDHSKSSAASGTGAAASSA